jgi:hypothetical protein
MGLTGESEGFICDTSTRMLPGEGGAVLRRT